jgi:hypothetical protein
MQAGPAWVSLGSFQYEHVLIQSVAAQSQDYCQQQHVVGRDRKVRNSGSRLVARELSVGPYLAPMYEVWFWKA